MGAGEQALLKRRSRIIEVKKTKRGAALATENPCAAPCFLLLRRLLPVRRCAGSLPPAPRPHRRAFPQRRPLLSRGAGPPEGQTSGPPGGSRLLYRLSPRPVCLPPRTWRRTEQKRHSRAGTASGKLIFSRFPPVMKKIFSKNLPFFSLFLPIRFLLRWAKSPKLPRSVK